MEMIIGLDFYGLGDVVCPHGQALETYDQFSP